jgi:hypothetical protein
MKVIVGCGDGGRGRRSFVPIGLFCKFVFIEEKEIIFNRLYRNSIHLILLNIILFLFLPVLSFFFNIF